MARTRPQISSGPPNPGNDDDCHLPPGEANSEASPMKHRRNTTKFITIATIFAALALVSSTVAVAQSLKVEGVIKARSGNTMTLQTQDQPKLVVILNDQTQVSQVEGVFKARRKEMSMAALIP